MADVVDTFLPLLGQLFEYLAEDRRPSPRPDRPRREERPAEVMARLWCVLYLVRPDLVRYETTTAAARRYGVSLFYINAQLREIKEMFPDARLSSRPRGHTGGSRRSVA